MSLERRLARAGMDHGSKRRQAKLERKAYNAAVSALRIHTAKNESTAPTAAVPSGARRKAS